MFLSMAIQPQPVLHPQPYFPEQHHYEPPYSFAAVPKPDEKLKQDSNDGSETFKTEKTTVEDYDDAKESFVYQAPGWNIDIGDAKESFAFQAPGWNKAIVSVNLKRVPFYHQLEKHHSSFPSPSWNPYSVASKTYFEPIH